MTKVVMTQTARGAVDGVDVRTFQPGDTVPPSLVASFLRQGVAETVSDDPAPPEHQESEKPKTRQTGANRRARRREKNATE